MYGGLRGPTCILAWSALLVSSLAWGPAHAQPSEAPRAYPEEVLELLPRELLDELPAAMTSFLRVEDYRLLVGACPDVASAEGSACLVGEAGLERLTRVYLQSVVVAVLDQMDAELSRRVAREELENVAARCEAAIAPWADCVFADGPDAETCTASAERLASCVTEDDAVGAAYASSQDDKKAAWGDPDSYVALRGLLALYPLDVVREVRGGCPQSDADALNACLAAHPVTGPAYEAFGEVVGALVAEGAAQLGAAGHHLDAASQAALGARLEALFFTVPLRAVSAIATACERDNPALATLDDPAEIELLFTCLEQGSDSDAVANPAFITPDKLRSWLSIGRAKVEAAVERKEVEAQARAFNLVLLVLLGVAALGGLVIVLLPLRLRRKHPGAVGLWRGSLLAAGVFVGVIIVLGTALLVMRTVQGAVGTTSTSPKMRVADAAFSVLESDDYVEGFSELSKLRLDFIKAPLRTLAVDVAGAEGPDRAVAVAVVIGEHWGRLLQQPEIKRLATNIGHLTEQAQTYVSLIGTLKNFDWVLGYVPMALALLAVLLYLLPMKETLVRIALGPARAAAGGDRGTRASLAEVAAELKLVGPYLLIVIILLPLAGLFIAFAIEPLMEMVINVALLQVFQLIGSEPSAFAIQSSLLGAILLLALTIAVYIIAIAFYIGTARKVLRARYREGRALSEFKGFWIYGTLALVAVQLFPVLFAQLARLGQHALIGDFAGPMSDTQLWVAPAASVVAFGLLFWALRGVKALGYIKRDPTRAAAAPATL